MYKIMDQEYKELLWQNAEPAHSVIIQVDIYDNITNGTHQFTTHSCTQPHACKLMFRIIQHNYYDHISLIGIYKSHFKVN